MLTDDVLTPAPRVLEGRLEALHSEGRQLRSEPALDLVLLLLEGDCLTLGGPEQEGHSLTQREELELRLAERDTVYRAMARVQHEVTQAARRSALAALERLGGSEGRQARGECEGEQCESCSGESALQRDLPGLDGLLGLWRR